MKKIISKAAVLLALLVFCFAALSACGSKETPAPEENPAENTPTDAENTPVGEVENATIEIVVQDYGTITVELDGKAAPITVANFVKLAEEGFYDGLTFHRIMSGFMIQGGDPNGNGTGGADETIKGEFAENGVENPLSHTRGAISMARNDFDMDSASSQFFIVHDDAAVPSLNGKYAAFGYVTDGMDVVDAICEAVVPIDNNGTVVPADQPIITSVTVKEAAQ